MMVMKVIGGFIGLTIVGTAVASIATNPGKPAYFQFAEDQLINQIKTEGCPRLTETVKELINVQISGLTSQCHSFVDVNRGQFKDFVINHTERQNYVMFSLYKTNLALSDFLPFVPKEIAPRYYSETVGIFNSFYIYKTEERQS